jgi:hypothetical protein
MLNSGPFLREAVEKACSTHPDSGAFGKLLFEQNTCYFLRRAIDLLVLVQSYPRFIARLPTV